VTWLEDKRLVWKKNEVTGEGKAEGDGEVEGKGEVEAGKEG
jgi:hypothetical protein